MLMTNDQIDELASAMTDLSGLDSELVERTGVLVRAQRYDDAVSGAFIVLEERMRALMGMRGGSGRQLVSKLFSEKDPQYIQRLNLPEQEWMGLRSIFDGAFAAYRNRAAHTVAGYSLEEAQAVIHLVNLLLLTLSQIQNAPGQHVPDEMSHVLGLAVTDRLNRFLDGILRMGMTRARGKQWLPYKARLLYHPKHWEKPKWHNVTVFYLTTSKKVPVLGFYVPALECVPDLDMERLTTQLLQAGCIRTTGKDIPIQLLLQEKNDQTTFDRLHEILAELIQKHGE